MPAAGVVDLHNHLLPGVDDGAADDAGSRVGLAAFADAGVVRACVTPHVTGSLTGEPAALERRLAELDRAWEQLIRVATADHPGLKLLRAAEVMLSVPEVDLSDPRLRIGGGRYALVEFPFLMVPPRSAEALARLAERGWLPVLAHPERYAGLDGRLGLAGEWKAAGAVLQVNGPSLLGAYGADIRARAEALLAQGLVDYVASDYHSRGRPLIPQYVRRLAESAAEEQVTLLTQTNPARIADGQVPIPVGPVSLRRQRLWSRVFGR